MVRERDFGDLFGGTGHGEFVDAVVVEVVIAYEVVVTVNVVVLPRWRSAVAACGV